MSLRLSQLQNWVSMKSMKDVEQPMNDSGDTLSTPPPPPPRKDSINSIGSGGGETTGPGSRSPGSAGGNAGYGTTNRKRSSITMRRSSYNRSVGQNIMLDRESGHRSIDGELSLGSIYDFNSSVNHKSSSTNFSFDPVKERDEIVNESETGGANGSPTGYFVVKSSCIKISLILFLAALAAGVAIGVCYNARNYEQQEFVTAYQHAASQIGNTFASNMEQHLQSIENLGIHTTSFTAATATATDGNSSSSSSSTWPFVTVPDFELRGLSTIKMGHSLSTIILPVVSDEDRLQYENYTQLHYQDWSSPSSSSPSSFSSETTTDSFISPVIYRFGDNGPEPQPAGEGPYFPGWTMSPVLPSPPTNTAVNFNFATAKGFADEIQTVYDQQDHIVLGRTHESDRFNNILLPNNTVSEPVGITYVPIFDHRYDSNSQDNMVGLFMNTISWSSILTVNGGLLYSKNEKTDEYGLMTVLDNDCGDTAQSESQQFSFLINAESGEVEFLGEGDRHDETYDDLKTTYSLQSLLGTGNDFLISQSKLKLDTTYCNYRIYVYPSAELEESYQTNNRIWYAIAIALIFVITASVFACYDVIMEHRKQRILQAAVEARMIVASLFPEQVRGRLFEQQRKVTGKVKGMLTSGYKKISRKLSVGGGSSSFASFRGGSSSSVTSSRHTTSVDLGGDDTEVSESYRGSGGGSSNKSTNNDGSETRRPSLVSQSTIRLKSYLSSSRLDTLTGGDGSKRPIADLFPNTTVMFADIAGFTKWCSQRDPEQVFFLLESIYGVFDKLARKRGVFKVETIGDCYMAVTGLPDAQDDHSWRMAKYTLDCRTKLADLLKELEVVLGPDTSELCMRTGMHSGPTTAGVLRGDKSRFQLFGDTVNTASRMESTGEPNRIQLSQATAESLIAMGKEGWIRKRQDLVEAKGKGSVQTYWLASRPKEVEQNKPDELFSMGDKRKLDMYAMGGKGISTRMGFADNLSDSDTDSFDDDDEFDEEKRRPALSRINSNSVGQSMMHVGEMSTLFEEGSRSFDDIAEESFNAEEMKARQKSIMWQSELLMRCLRLIVARRVPSEKTVDVSGLKIETYPGCVVIDEVAESIELPEFDAQVIRNSDDPEDVTLSRAVIAQVHDYVATIASMYPAENAFHNFEHATHMAMAASKLLSRVVVQDCDDVEEATELHASTDGINSDPLVQFSIVFASLIHDVDHPGISNAQLAIEDPELSQMYKQKSIAEQKAVDVAWDVLMEPKYLELRACIYSNQSELVRFRQLVVNSVLATDLHDSDMKELRSKRWERVFGDASQEMTLGNRKATIVIEHICQVADIAHCMQHWLVFTKFNERLFIERLDAYHDGRSEAENGGKDPAETFYEDELTFFDEIVIPLAQRLGDCEVFGVAGSECLGYAQGNREEWAVKGQDIVKEMLASYDRSKTQQHPPFPSSNVAWHESNGSLSFEPLKDD